MHYFLTIFIVFFGSIVSINANVITTDPNFLLDCSRFRRDIDILRSFPYSVQLNPMTIGIQTYAIINDNSQVEELHIQNEIYLSHDVFCLINLHTLKVNGTRFISKFELDDSSLSTGLTPLISRLHRLRVLLLINTTASYIPHHALSALTNLTRLDIENCGLREIPPTITSLVNLQILRLPKNHLTTLPQKNAITEGINSLTSLTDVMLSYNRFVSLEPLSGLPKLNNLVAEHNHLEILPINLPKIQYLYMSHNNFEDLNDLADLKSTSLYSMDFSHNKIDHIPPSINRFASTLRYLDLNNNSLSYLPTNIFQLRNVYSIDLRNNHFPTTDLNAIKIKFQTDVGPNKLLI